LYQNTFTFNFLDLIGGIKKKWVRAAVDEVVRVRNELITVECKKNS